MSAPVQPPLADGGVRRADDPHPSAHPPRTAMLPSLRARVFRSRALARLLLGIDFGPLGPEDYYFDVTTLVLARYAARRVTVGSRVVDMGTGAVAALAQVLCKRTGCRVVAAEANPALAASAEASVRRSGAPVRVVRSRWFAAVDEPFDTVVFNPPYVPTPVGEARGLSQVRRSQWDGGPDGTGVLREFLAELRARSHPALALVGVNRLHLSAGQVRGLVEETPGLHAESVWCSRLLPVDVHEIRGPGTGGGRG